MSRSERVNDLESHIAEKTELKKPPRYHVVLHNDDYTTMEFVVYILAFYFQKSNDEAISIMMDVHKKGSGIAGTYPREIAETKIQQVHHEARKKGYPLKCTLQKE